MGAFGCSHATSIALRFRPLAGTEGALHPFFSPDGRALGFLTNDKVKTYSFVAGTSDDDLRRRDRSHRHMDRRRPVVLRRP